jgi:thymidylate synthase (FAD)
MNSSGLKLIETAGRTCYKSENRITEESCTDFVNMLKKNGHHAMLEFGWLCYKVICDRGVSHEIVRHRLFSFAQESTRYVDSGCNFIIPPWIELKEGEYPVYFKFIDYKTEFPAYYPEVYYWLVQMARCAESYRELRSCGWKPQQARSVLPNSLKTEIVIAGNLREWMHFFKLRCAKSAHPQMQEIANMILEDARKRVPVVFDE